MCLRYTLYSRLVNAPLERFSAMTPQRNNIMALADRYIFVYDINRIIRYEYVELRWFHYSTEKSFGK